MDTAQIIFATLLPIALMSVPIAAIVTYHRRKMEEMRLGARNQAGKGDAAYEELEERMRILERIVTDRGFDVAHQIEALRDRQAQLPGRELDRQS